MELLHKAEIESCGRGCLTRPYERGYERRLWRVFRAAPEQARRVQLLTGSHHQQHFG